MLCYRMLYKLFLSSVMWTLMHTQYRVNTSSGKWCDRSDLSGLHISLLTQKLL